MPLTYDQRLAYDWVLFELIDLTGSSARFWKRDEELQAIALHKLYLCTDELAIARLVSAQQAFETLRDLLGVHETRHHPVPEPEVTPGHLLHMCQVRYVILQVLRRESGPPGRIMRLEDAELDRLRQIPADFWEAAAQFIDNYVLAALGELEHV